MIRTIDFGNENGINILIISGVHGDEVGAIKTSYNLYQEFQIIKASNDLPSRILNFGKISFIHVANRDGVRNRCRDMVYDGNLNNMFSTSADPKREIIEAIDDAQFVIDLHCSPYVASGFIFDTDYKSYLFKNFLENNFFYDLSTIRLSYGVRHTEACTIKSYVNSLKGKIGFTWEQNGMDQHSLTDNVDMLVEIIYSFEKFNEYLQNELNMGLNDIVSCHLPHYMPELSTMFTTPVEGILSYYQPLGAIVSKNSLIAGIRDLNTNQLIYTIKAPFDCKFISGNCNLYVHDAEFIAMIQPYKKTIDIKLKSTPLLK